METVCDDMAVGVLVVDDDEVALASWRSILRQPAFAVASARDGDGALVALRELACDVVVFDLGRGGEDEAGPRLEQLGQLTRARPGVPVVATCAEPSEAMLRQAVRSGAYTFLCKPLASAHSVALTLRSAAEHARLARLLRESGNGSAAALRDDDPLTGLTQLVGTMLGVDKIGYTDLKARVLTAFDRAYLTGLLRRTDGNISRAARLAELDRSNFRRLMKRTRAR